MKRGCVLAQTILSLMFAVMLFTTLSQTSAGITIRYRTDGRFFDLRRLKAKAKVVEALIRDFQFADDSALAATQRMVTGACCPSLCCLQSLWPHHQSEEDRSAATACPLVSCP